MEHLLNIMARLRDPENGCPWDLEQDFHTILPYTIEETYEVAEAIRTQDIPALREELGDLLLQVIFHSQIAKDKNLFCFDDVVQQLSSKLVSRHPHVFGDENAAAAQDVNAIWERQKAKEKPPGSSVLDDVPQALPALMRAQKLQKRAAKIGFDWPDTKSVLEKLDEEIIETSDALNEYTASPCPAHYDHLEEEIGDLLFVMVNLARKAGFDAEEALNKANHKFIRRFMFVEQQYENDKKNNSLDQLESYWQQAKIMERQVTKVPSE